MKVKDFRQTYFPPPANKKAHTKDTVYLAFKVEQPPWGKLLHDIITAGTIKCVGHLAEDVGRWKSFVMSFLPCVVVFEDPSPNAFEKVFSLVGLCFIDVYI